MAEIHVRIARLFTPDHHHGDTTGLIDRDQLRPPRSRTSGLAGSPGAAATLGRFATNIRDRHHAEAERQQAQARDVETIRTRRGALLNALRTPDRLDGATGVVNLTNKEQ
ncbi:hypothetical protein GXB85_04180 [Cellulomonas sp. APG4]|uniref:hypothetical protein n=1 Tax=Cellulomonas sp. APG4 TaxID=1538656 RepID=UPI0013795540|nr:hypothetical protein [Cellulomonas sp. APG4]NCT90151.1 hypothetical protein [Cellulomonas sp. APG4]